MFFKNLSVFFIFPALFINLTFAQSVLVDDAPMCGHHDRYTYQALWDTLTHSGCTVDFTTDVGRYPDLSSYDFVVLMHHGTCADAGFTDTQKTQLINFVCSGGQLLLIPMDNIYPIDELLSDPRWRTGIKVSYPYYPGGRTSCIAPFPPLTNGVSFIDWGLNVEYLVRPPAYPFVWDSSCTRNWAVVSYPIGVDSTECNTCESGGRIIGIGENHIYEYEVIGYVDPVSYHFIVNILTALAGIGDTLIPCQLPEGVPQLDSIPCASPGETAHLYGRNISPDMSLFFEDSSISFTWIDSSEVSFTIPPDAEQGYHTVTVEIDGHRFNIWVNVYCNWLKLTAFEPFCADIGDTVWFYGENFSPTATLSMGGIPIPSFSVETDTSGWFVVPDTVGGEGYPSTGGAYRYRFRIENSSTQSDFSWILVPCPCSPDSDVSVSIANLGFTERTDGADTVYIFYDLTASSAQNIVLWCSSDGGETWDIPCTTLTGAVGNGISPGDSLVIIWATGNDIPDNEGSNWAFRIDVSDVGGSGGSPPVSPDTLTPWAMLASGDSAGCIAVITGGAPYYGLGNSVSSAGDVNGDGYDDIIIGSSGAGASGQGEAYIFFGSPGFSGRLFPADADVVIIGGTVFGMLGTSVSSAGDVNGDGYDDVIVDEPNSGQVYIFFGGTGLPDSLSTSSADVVLTAESSISEFFGWCVSDAGDVNNDGYDDIIAGATGAGGSNGRAYIFFGGPWLTGTISASSANVIITGEASGDHFGWSVSGAGDINNDGYDDIIVGTYEYSAGGSYYNIGRAYVFLGSSTLSGFISATSANATITGEASEDQLGYSVSSAGDVNGDGYDDVIVGAPYNDAGGTIAGRAYVFFGSSGFGGALLAASADIIITGESAEDHLGFSVSSAGDINNDGYGDIIVGADSAGTTGAGEAYVFFGSAGISGALSVTSADITVTGEALNDHLGYSVSVAGDIDDDGRSDIVIGAQSSGGAGIMSGRAYVYTFPVNCPFGAIYTSWTSQPGPVDTYCPRVAITCPPDGEVGAYTTINWATEEAFISPATLSPAFPIEIYFSPDGGATWNFVGTSPNDGSFTWIFPPVITDSAYLMVCATDSFGHTCCDTCGPFAITGDTVKPWGYAITDTCSPDSVIFVLRDDVGIDWSSVCIQDPLGVLCYPDSMRSVDDSILIFYPRLPDSIMDATRYFYVRLWSARDSSGNDVPEMLVEDSLTVRFRHPCCVPVMVWRECPPAEWNDWSSCAGQEVTFGVFDTTGQEIDTARIYIRQTINGVERTLPPDSLIFSRTDDTLWVTIPGGYSDMDSVWILLDSLFTKPGCETSF